MLALLGALTVLVLLAAILLDLLSPLVALIVVPVVAALAGGFGLETSKFIIAGISADRAGGRDVRLRDPLLRHHDRCRPARPDHRPHPARGRAPADADRARHGAARAPDPPGRLGRGLPSWSRSRPCCRCTSGSGMDRRVLACVASLAAGVNFLPWTGPTLRASAALKIPVTDLFRPLIPVQAVGLATSSRSPSGSAGARSVGSGWRAEPRSAPRSAGRESD